MTIWSPSVSYPVRLCCCCVACLSSQQSVIACQVSATLYLLCTMLSVLLIKEVITKSRKLISHALENYPLSSTCVKFNCHMDMLVDVVHTYTVSQNYLCLLTLLQPTWLSWLQTLLSFTCIILPVVSLPATNCANHSYHFLNSSSTFISHDLTPTPACAHVPNTLISSPRKYIGSFSSCSCSLPGKSFILP